MEIKIVITVWNFFYRFRIKKSKKLNYIYKKVQFQIHWSTSQSTQ